MRTQKKRKLRIERVRKVFAEHLQQSTNFELLWSDKVGFVWLAIGLNRFMLIPEGG